MIQVDPQDWAQLTEAVALWTGWRRFYRPKRDDRVLVSHFGEETAAQVLPKIKALEDDFYATTAGAVASDFQQMERMAIYDFLQKYPDAPKDLLDAFVWCYTYDYK